MINLIKIPNPIALLKTKAKDQGFGSVTFYPVDPDGYGPMDQHN